KRRFYKTSIMKLKKKDMVERGSTPFDHAYMNVSVFTQEKIKKRIWKMINDITKFQKVDPETIRTMVNFSEKNYEKMIKGEHEAI
ncbi:19263_t:CDS:2, partial [Racocetra persica]